MTFVKTVTRKSLDKVEYIGCLFFQKSFRNTTCYKTLLLFRYDFKLLLTYRLNQGIRLPKRNVPKSITYPHHLFLIDHYPKCLFKNLPHNRMRNFPIRPVLALYKISNQCHRARTIKCICRYQILKPVRLELHQQIRHTARFKLKYSLGLSAAENIQNLLIRKVNIFYIDSFSVNFLHQPNRPLYHTQSPQTQEIHLQKTNLLNHRPFELCHQVIRITRFIKRHKIR